MKIFLIDKYNNLNKFEKSLKEIEIENIEKKENCKFRMTKNDYILTSDENDLEGLDKLKNIIILVKNKEYKHIWNFVNRYKTLDVIDINMPSEYVAERIKRLVSDEK